MLGCPQCKSLPVQARTIQADVMVMSLIKAHELDKDQFLIKYGVPMWGRPDQACPNTARPQCYCLPPFGHALQALNLPTHCIGCRSCRKYMAASHNAGCVISGS